MLALNEKNFNEALKENPKLLVLFYREQGCKYCDNFKPIFKSYSENSEEVCGMYALGNGPDSIATEELIQKFPTVVSYVSGKILNVQTNEKDKKIDLTTMFIPPIIPIHQAPLAQLLSDEAALIDAIYPMKIHLEEIRQEIKKRRELV